MRLSMLCAAVALVSACSTPCNAPGGLCAPISSITSPPQQLPQQPLPKPPPEPLPPPAETFAVTLEGAGAAQGSGQTALAWRADPVIAPAVETGNAAARSGDDSATPPAATSGPQLRIALLLPLHSESLGAAANALRAGFMAAWERDRNGVNVNVIETGDVPQDVLASYARAQQSEDIVVGPLSRAAVGTVATSPLVSKPTIALNYPEGYGSADAAPLPPQMLAMGLSIEAEARQAAQWAAAAQPGASALILTTSTPWQRRVAAAFAAQWQRLGLAAKTVELSAPDGYLSDPELMRLRARLREDLPGLLFSAMGADQTSQLRGALASAMTTEADNPIFSTADAMPPPAPVPTEQFSNLAIYGTSALNPGASYGLSMDGVRLLDLPWQLQPDHPAVMSYPRPATVASADMARLYALGIDAYRVAREIGRRGAGSFQIDGVTGRLNISFGEGRASFERVEQQAAYQRGAAQPVAQ